MIDFCDVELILGIRMNKTGATVEDDVSIYLK